MGFQVRESLVAQPAVQGGSLGTTFAFMRNAGQGGGMVQGSERDVGRFKQIVRGKIREDLRKYVSNGEMIGKRGKDLVSIPLPQLNIPHFRYGKNGRGGVSSG